MKLKLLVASSVVFVALIAITLVHVYAYTSAKEGEYVHSQVQLCRIDFSRPLNQAERSELQRTLRQSSAVQQSQLSVAGDALVYSYTLGITPTNELNARLCTCTGVQAKVYVPTQEAIATSCPAGFSSNSYFHTVGRWLHSQID